MRFSYRATLVIVSAVILSFGASAANFSPDRKGRSPDGSGSVRGIKEVQALPSDGGGPRWLRSACGLPPEQLRRTTRGYYPGRSPELTFVPAEPDFFGDFKTTTTHSGPWPYVQRVPLVFYGPGFVRSQGEVRLEREATVADVAPTFAELLRTPFPDRRPGRVLRSVLLPRPERNGKPRLIMTVVWDGAGWNTLQQWPGAWPRLREVMDDGTSVLGTTVGSNPSVTPAIHANIGTGSFPAAHGIVSIPQRAGARIEDSWSGHSPNKLLIETLADMYDQRTQNKAKIGLLAEQDWHLGMIGHGAAVAKGDRDIAVLTRTDPFETNTRYYRLPSYMHEVGGFLEDRKEIDASDGNINGKWLGHPLPKDHGTGFANPVWSLYQMRLLRKLLTEERFGNDRVPDLFYTNFKQIDEVSHAYFLQSPEMRATIPYSDLALGELISWMNRHVGERRWVLAMTADHGVGPKFTEVGAWPIDMDKLLVDVALHFGLKVTDLFQSQRPQGFWLNMRTMRQQGVTLGEMSDFLLTYRIKDNRREGQRIPRQYRERLDDKLFAAAFPSARVTQMSDCADRNEPG